MPETVSRMTQILRPRARILRTLGDELISSETVAVIELVKNAYDADATRVLVRFKPPLEPHGGAIEILDNGHGMSLDVVKSDWMEPATLTKRRRNRSTLRNRRMLGEKGVGRFAASRLADYMLLVTRHFDSDREVRVLFDWSQFDDEQKYLDEVEVLLEETAPSVITPDGEMRALWNEEAAPPRTELTHGTFLQMEGLRTAWNRPQFEKLRQDLARLISPFFAADLDSAKDAFQIRLEIPLPYDDLSGIVEPPESLRNPHYTIKGSVDAEGVYDLALTVPDSRKPRVLNGQFQFKDGHAPRCGPFQIELRVWDRDPTSLEELARLSRSTIENVREDLDKTAGVNIYRDGFRVLPYGEPRNDWLRLDARRVQNPTRNLSNNQIAGYVLISADRNPELRDQSNREGLMEGPALDDLGDLVKMALTELEKRRYKLRPRQARAREGLFMRFDLGQVRALVKQRHPRDTKLIKAVAEKEREVRAGLEVVQNVLIRYHRLATLGQLVDTVLHDGRTPLSKIGNEAYLGLRDVQRAQKSNGMVEKLGSRLALIRDQSDVLATVFRRIEPFGGRKRGRPSRIILEQAIADGFAVLAGRLKEVGARATLPSTETQATADPAEIQEIIVNLLDNSLYWIRQVGKEHRRIAVEVHRVGPEEVQILFSDDGPGVDPEFRDHIFEPYFSTKPDGVGLGLSIAGEIAQDYYGGGLELVDRGPLSGATFRVTLRKRV